MPSVLYKIQPQIKYFSTGLPGVDTTAPIVTVISPPEGEIPGGLSSASKTPMVFTVQDVVPGFGFLRIRIRYANGVQCTVHNGTDFEGPGDGRDGFKVNSTKTALQFNKFSFSILPDNGWIDAFDIEVDAIDQAGNKSV